MKIKLSKFFTESKIFPEGEMRYFLNGLENPSDLDNIILILKSNFDVNVIRDIFVMWFRRVDLEKGNKRFILYWEEVLEVFFISNEKPEDEWLENFLKEVIPLIENYYNSTEQAMT
jgi:hypothetical protein